MRGTVPSDLEISQRDFIFSRLTPVTRPLGGESAVTSHDLPTLPPSESPGIFVRGRARVSCLFVLTGALSPRGIPTVQLPSPILRTRIGGGSRGYTNIWRISPRFHCLPAGRPPHLCASTFGAGGRAIAAAACACGAGIGRRTRGGDPPCLGGGGDIPDASPPPVRLLPPLGPPLLHRRHRLRRVSGRRLGHGLFCPPRGGGGPLPHGPSPATKAHRTTARPPPRPPQPPVPRCQHLQRAVPFLGARRGGRGAG